MKGISLFIVDRTAAGVEVERTEMTDTRNYANINFNNVEVAESALLGEEGKGFKLCHATSGCGQYISRGRVAGYCPGDFRCHACSTLKSVNSLVF